MRVELRGKPFDPLAELASYPVERTSAGASAHFIGTMRDHNEGDTVEGMVLEHYPGMTERELERITIDACRRHGLLDALVIHRYGALAPGDPIVLVAVWSEHRAAAFEGCRALMEALKSRAPFWKRETLADRSERWVSGNTPG